MPTNSIGTGFDLATARATCDPRPPSSRCSSAVTIAAPRHLVFDAFTKPELLKRWLGAFGGWELAVCEIDLRVGGKYRWVWR
ncbi:MAG TPA: SRPBCC domain-containing protein, partial [Candidatus Angelobacter sp.]|nr:SRPBCC domain-containing protein [Candidatus Angelobacter sp.]